MAESSQDLSAFLPAEILDRYEIRSYRNAAQILASSAAVEHEDLTVALNAFSLSIADIRKPGGNESDIPKRLSSLLRPRGWNETRITGDLHISKMSGSIPKVGDDDSESPSETIDPIQLRREGAP
ncbi:MAG: BglII/BstYI family type II restriction endonuclease, partial [Planctomycetia bacterium]